MFLHVLNVVFITGLLFALFLDFPCLEINLMPNDVFLNMSARMCSQLFRGHFSFQQKDLGNLVLKTEPLGISDGSARGPHKNLSSQRQIRAAYSRVVFMGIN